MSVIGSSLPFFFGSGAGPRLPAIGSSLQGGFFAGTISHTANGVATHLLIVAPAATGSNGGGALAWKINSSDSPGTTSMFNGSANSANMNDYLHPAAEYCEGLTIGGYTDWYLPARYELEIAYYNLKPTTTNNSTSWGINPYSVPARGINYTAGTPAQTTVTAFQTGNSEAFIANDYWSSTENNVYSTNAWFLYLSNGVQNESDYDKTSIRYVRAFRKVAV